MRSVFDWFIYLYDSWFVPLISFELIWTASLLLGAVEVIGLVDVTSFTYLLFYSSFFILSNYNRSFFMLLWTLLFWSSFWGIGAFLDGFGRGYLKVFLFGRICWATLGWSRVVAGFSSISYSQRDWLYSIVSNLLKKARLVTFSFLPTSSSSSWSIFLREVVCFVLLLNLKSTGSSVYSEWWEVVGSQKLWEPTDLLDSFSNSIDIFSTSSKSSLCLFLMKVSSFVWTLFVWSKEFKLFFLLKPSYEVLLTLFINADRR